MFIIVSSIAGLWHYARLRADMGTLAVVPSLVFAFVVFMLLTTARQDSIVFAELLIRLFLTPEHP